jgi:peptidoglycan/LPS O-acetylase OafA/YrhL
MTRNPSLHGLRGLAALSVVVLHLHLAVQTGGFPLRLDDAGIAARALAVGHRGVELFFMISGYLIVGSLVRGRSVLGFLRNRMMRIYPAFLVPHLLIFAAGPWYGYAWMAGLDPLAYVGHFLSNLLMLPGVFDLPIANMVAWTLSLEMAFYLLAAAAMALAAGRLPKVIQGALWTVWLAAALAVLLRHPRAWFLVVGVAAYFLRGRPETGTGSRILGVDRPSTTRCRVPVPFSGPPIRPEPTQEAAPGWRSCAGLLALAGLCLLYDVWLPASLACGLLGFLALVRQRDLLCLLLRTRPFQYLGDISYSLYLWHAVAIFPLRRLFDRPGGLLPGEWLNLAAFLAAAAVASLAAGHLSSTWIEQRFTHRFLRRATRPEPQSPSEAPARIAA